MASDILRFLTICVFSLFLLFILCFAVLFAFGIFTGLSDLGSPPPVSDSNSTEIPYDFTDFNESNASDLPQSVSSSSDNVLPSFPSSDYYTRNYSWSYNGYNQSLSITIPKEYYEYYRNKSHSGKNYDSYALSESDRQFLGKMIDSFKEQGSRNNFTDDQVALNVIAFVQAMPYTSDSVTTGSDEYPRYPIETLVDGGGDCEDSSILAAALLSEMGYGVVLLSPPGHMALGIKGSENITGSYYEYNGSRYFYVETTSSGYKVGDLPYEFQGSKVRIYTMNSTPSVYVNMRATPVGYDQNYIYYKIHCDINNYGPTSAKNTTVNIFAEASPYDMTRVWPPEVNVNVGTILDDSSGWAEGIVKIPRNNYTMFSCTVSGDNFNPVYVHTKVVYID